MNNERMNNDEFTRTDWAILIGTIATAVTVSGYVLWKQLQQEKADIAKMFGR